MWTTKAVLRDIALRDRAAADRSAAFLDVALYILATKDGP